MKTSGIVVLVYGLLILIGGFMGHVKAASTASLVMGVIFGVLLIAAAIGLFKGKAIAGYCALILGVILDAFFTFRLMKTLKFMPSGLMSIISLIFILVLAVLLRKGLPKRKQR